MSGMPIVFALFVLIFVVVFGIIAFVIVRLIGVALHNAGRPVIDRPARVIGRRQDTWGGSGDSSAHTSYYAKFEFPDGSRLELSVPTREYAMLAEGDAGILRSQGTWFKGFDRSRDPHVV